MAILGSYLTTEEVAKRLGVTAGRVRQFVTERRLRPKEKIGQVLFFEAKEVTRFADTPRKAGRPKKQ